MRRKHVRIPVVRSPGALETWWRLKCRVTPCRPGALAGFPEVGPFPYTEVSHRGEVAERLKAAVC